MGLKNTVDGDITPGTGPYRLCPWQGPSCRKPALLPGIPTGKLKDYKYYDNMSRGSRRLVFPDSPGNDSIIVRNACLLSTHPALPASRKKAKQGRGDTTTLSIPVKIQKSYTSLTIGTTTGSRSRTRRKKRRNEARMPSCKRVSWPGRTDSISSSTKHLASSSTWL